MSPGADWLQASAVHAQDTLTGHFIDSVVVESPLPDPLVPIVQWLFQKPGWVMGGGIVLGAIVGAVVAVFLLAPPAGDLDVAASPGSEASSSASPAAVGAVLLLMVGTGVKAYDYMMHDNDFCRGCHIFVPSGQAFVRPDTGTYLLVNKVEGTHDSLSCHACHPFELEAQTKELFYWIVERPGQGAAPCQGAEGDLRAVPRAGSGQEDLAADRVHRRPSHPPRVRLLGPEGRGLPHLPRAHGPPLPAGRHDLRPAGLPPHRRGEDPARAAWPPASTRRTWIPTRSSSTATPATSSPRTRSS